jgi:hypothetical protein
MGFGSFLKKVGGYGVRVGTAWVSGGASEAYRKKTGHADPVTKKGEDTVDYVGNKVGEVTDSNSSSGGGTGETPEDQERRRRLQEGVDTDLEAARKYRDRAVGEPTLLPRDAPQVTAPGAITPIQAGAPGTVKSTFDTTDADEARAAAQAWLAKQQLIAEGKAGPSAAELAMRRGNADAIRSQLALTAGSRGYSQGGQRRAADNIATLQQQNIAQTGELRAQEQAAAQQRVGEALSSGRQQDITLATAKGGQELDAARANQAATLQTTLANAGWGNEAILKMSDQELQTKLANAGYKLTQQQMDDLREKAQRDWQLQAQGQALTAGQAAAGSAQDREAKLAQLRQMQEEAKRRGDAATEQMLATMISTYMQYG